MKIVNVRAVQPEASRNPAGWRGSIGQILVAVDTDDGLAGYGMGGGGEAGIHIVHTVLRDAILGKDASDVEGLWSKMYGDTIAFGRKGVVIMAISGVDLALWDLRGKRENKPLVEVLGGTTENAIRGYRTGGREGLEKAIEDGYRVIKIGGLGRFDPKNQVEEVVDLIREVRKVVGPDITVMTDASMAWDVEGALLVAERIAEFDVDWLEEPLAPDDMAGYAELSRRSRVPIASGEHEYTAAAFKTIVERRLHSVIQPDVCWCGGLTELVKIYGMANDAGVRMCPHRGSEVWSLHAIAALDPKPLAESGRPWMEWVGGPRIENGEIRLSQKPGFGVEFDEDLW